MTFFARKVAQELRTLADDIATGDRVVDGIAWYSPSDGPVPGLASEWALKSIEKTPIVPRAIHDALCVSLAVVLEDELDGILICDRCKLAVQDLGL